MTKLLQIDGINNEYHKRDFVIFKIIAVFMEKVKR